MTLEAIVYFEEVATSETHSYDTWLRFIWDIMIFSFCFKTQYVWQLKKSQINIMRVYTLHGDIEYPKSNIKIV